MEAFRLPEPSRVPDDDCLDAVNAIKTNIANTGNGSMVRDISFVSFSSGDLAKAAVSKTGGFSAKLSARAASIGARTPRFVLMSGTGPGTTSNMYQMIHLNTRYANKPMANQTTRVITYPPSPLSNLAVVPVRGRRSRGEFAMNTISGYFWPNPASVFSPTLLDQLNRHDLAPGSQNQAHTIADAGRVLFSYEKDFFQDNDLKGWRGRKSPLEGWGRGRLIDTAVSLQEGYIVPTLIDTDILDTSKWSNFPKSKDEDKIINYGGAIFHKDRRFFIALTPYRDSTLLILYYPVVGTFGERGQLLSTDLFPGWITWIVSGAIRLLSNEANVEIPSSVQMDAKHPYWSVVNTIRERKVFGGSIKTLNAPVPPFEKALKEVESSPAGIATQIQQPLEAIKPGRKFCTHCGVPVQPNHAFCNSCGTSLESTANTPRPCPNCGASYEPGNAFCTKCGTSLSSAGT